MKRFEIFSLLLSLFFLFAGSSSLEAQRRNDEESDNDRGKVQFKGSPAKILELANEFYRVEDYATAKEGYVEVLKKDPENYFATYRVAKCSYFIHEYEEAVKYLESAVEIDKEANDTVYFELGMIYRILGRHNDARVVYKEFQKRWEAKDDFARRVKIELKGCDYVEEQRGVEPAFTVKCIDVNEGASDFSPSVLKQLENEKYLVFTSHRRFGKNKEKFGGMGEESYSDLFQAKMENDSTFGEVEWLGKKVNGKLNDGNTTFSPDGMTMFFSICNQSKLGYGCSIYESKYDPRKKRWNKPKIVEELKGEREVIVNTLGKTKTVPTYDVHPMLTTDGNTMFFVSNRDGGQGRLDIWYSTWDGESWSDPQNAGARINTPFNDVCPFQNEDGSALYFASDGRVGFGGLDLYKSEGQMGRWADPVNLGAPINSSYDDMFSFWTVKDSTAFFSSNRPGCGQGGRDDIYLAEAIPKSPKEFTVHGKVLDRETGMPVPFGTVILFEIDFEGDRIPLDTFRTDQDAEYNFVLKPNRKYKVIGNAPEYLANEVDFNTEDLEKTDLEVDVPIKLERIIIEKVIALNHIYYDFDKYDLRPKSVEELNYLIDLMNKNDNIIIQIGSHTDSNGSEPYNKNLSENRGKSVVSFLLDNGIAGDRLLWYGYGESQLLIYPELSDEDEQLNRRSEFRIKSIDYVGKTTGKDE